MKLKNSILIYRDEDEQTPLYYASSTQTNTELVKILLEAGAKVCFKGQTEVCHQFQCMLSTES